MGGKQSQLTPKDINAMKEETSFTEDEIRSFHKSFTDQYPNGRLTASDLKKLYKEIYPKGDPHDIISELFLEYDVDKNGSIDFREFLCGMGSLIHGNENDKLRLAFQMYDIDSSGYISLYELRKLIRAIYKAQCARRVYDAETADAVAESIFRQLVQNHDNKITFAEFLEGAKKDPRIVQLLQVDLVRL